MELTGNAHRVDIRRARCCFAPRLSQRRAQPEHTHYRSFPYQLTHMAPRGRGVFPVV
jgi:hypothetical protein